MTSQVEKESAVQCTSA